MRIKRTRVLTSQCHAAMATRAVRAQGARTAPTASGHDARRYHRRRQRASATTHATTHATTMKHSGAVLCMEKVQPGVFVATTASGCARVGALGDADGVMDVFWSDDDARGGDGAGDGDVRARGPFWCVAALGHDGDVVAFGSSGNHLVCADVDGDGVLKWRTRAEDVLGPHTGYVRSVVYSRALRRAYSCACNFAPSWIWDDVSKALRATPECEHLKLFTGDILKLCVFDDRVVFAGVADGTVHAFDVSRPETPKDLGTLGEARANGRGRVAALAVIGDKFIASGSHDGRLEVHDATNARLPALARLDISGGKIHAVARLQSHALVVAGDFGVKIIAFDANSSTFSVIDDAFSGITTSARAVAVVDDAHVLVGDASGSMTLHSLEHK